MARQVRHRSGRLDPDSASACAASRSSRARNRIAVEFPDPGLAGTRGADRCVDARHTKAALRVQINKTDANDAHGLSQVVRTGWFREVTIKSMDAQSLRLLLVVRAQLISQRQATANTLRGLLKAFGYVVRKGAGGLFAARVREVCDGNPALCAIAEPMPAVWQSLRADPHS
jgi:transposase